MSFTKKALIVLITLFGFACSYEPDGENFVDVDPTFDPLNDVVEFLPEDDTLLVHRKITVRYSFNSDESKLMAVYFIVDSALVRQLSNHSGSFDIEPNKGKFTPGTHEVILQAVVSSGTGSLADKIGAEGYVFTKVYTVRIVEVDPTTPEFVSIDSLDGHLQVKWTKSTDPYFDYYLLKRNYYGQTFETRIYDANDTVHLDEMYAGGQVRFYIQSFYLNEVLKSNSAHQDFYDTIPSPRIETDGTKRVRISWDKSKYYKNIDNYILKFQDYSNKYIEIAEVDPDDELGVFFDDSYFNDQNVLNLHTVPKGGLDQYSHYGDFITRTVYSIGKEFYQFYFYTLMSDGRMLFRNEDFNLSIYDIPNDRLEEYDRSYNLNVIEASPNGRYIIERDQNYSYFTYDNMDMIAQVSKNFFNLGNYEYPILYSVDNNGIGAMFISKSSKYLLHLFDFVNNEMIYSDQETDYEDCALSPDGKYIYVRTYQKAQICEITQQGLIPVIEYDSPTNFFRVSFYPDESKLMVIFNGSQVDVINYETRATLSSFTTDARRMYNVDFQNGTILMSNFVDLSVYKISTGDKIFDTKINRSVSNTNLFHFNNELFWGSSSDDFPKRMKF